MMRPLRQRSSRVLAATSALAMGFAAQLWGSVTAASPSADIDGVLGFEAQAPLDWSTIWNSPGSLASAADHSQGSRSLSVTTNGFTWIESKPIASLGERVKGPFHVDVKLPAQLQQQSPSWYGLLQLYVDCPSQQLNNVYVGQIELTGLPLAQWKGLTISPAADVVTKLKGAYNDLRIRIAVNAPSSLTAPFLIDNLRFSDAVMTSVKARTSTNVPLFGTTITAYQHGVPTAYTGVTDASGVAQLFLPTGVYTFGLNSGAGNTFSKDTCVVPGDCSGEEVLIVLFKKESQDDFNKLYDLDNVLTIEIDMTPANWEKVQTAIPRGGSKTECAGDWPANTIDEKGNITELEQKRYDWIPVDKVKITGTKYPTTPWVVTRWGLGEDQGPQIKKKSHCGSVTYETNEKPSLKLKLPEMPGTGADQFPVKSFTLNNGKQDRYFVKQALGYRLYRDAGLPSSRYNFANVKVNGNLVSHKWGDADVDSTGIYLNVEPIKDAFLANPENGLDANYKGNLYELEHHDEFHKDRLVYVDREDEGDGYKNFGDFKFTADAIENSGLTGVKNSINMENLIQTLAMEYLLKHWDGYSVGLNNTYIYNDGPGIKFKFIPWGLDQILGTGSKFEIGTKTEVAKLVVNDAQQLALLQKQISQYRETVFSRERVENDLDSFIRQIETIVTGLGADPVKVKEDADKRRFQLKLARSAGFLFGGEDSQVARYVLDAETHHALYRSSVTLAGTEREVVHTKPDGLGADLWRFERSAYSDSQYKVTSVSDPNTPQYLHASISHTPAGHQRLYTTPDYSWDYPKQDYFIQPECSSGELNLATKFTGYFRMENSWTDLCLFFGNDDTLPNPDPNQPPLQRVYQESCAIKHNLYWY